MNYYPSYKSSSNNVKVELDLTNYTKADLKNITHISGLATKTDLNEYLQTSTFNSKVTEVENKI